MAIGGNAQLAAHTHSAVAGDGGQALNGTILSAVTGETIDLIVRAAAGGRALRIQRPDTGAAIQINALAGEQRAQFLASNGQTIFANAHTLSTLDLTGRGWVVPFLLGRAV